MIYHTDIPLQQQPDCFDFSIDISDRPHLHAFFMLDLGWQVCVQRMIAAHCKVSGGGLVCVCVSLTLAEVMFALRCRGRWLMSLRGRPVDALCVWSTSRYCTRRETAVGDVLLSYRLKGRGKKWIILITLSFPANMTLNYRAQSL